MEQTLFIIGNSLHFQDQQTLIATGIRFWNREIDSYRTKKKLVFQHFATLFSSLNPGRRPGWSSPPAVASGTALGGTCEKKQTWKWLNLETKLKCSDCNSARANISENKPNIHFLQFFPHSNFFLTIFDAREVNKCVVFAYFFEPNTSCSFQTKQ
jgi:hypothetical protein